MRNALSLVPMAAQQMVEATIRTIFAQSPTQGALASNGVGSQMASGIGSGGSRS